jgi:EAL domain-containing protein (putative c-di-GMP-specific phosphodiesterase class I)
MTSSPAHGSAVARAPRLLDSADWPGQIARALRGEGVAVHYQPIVDLKRAVVVGYEALLRFPGHPVSSPAAWLDAAHGLGFGGDLEALALRLAFAARPLLPDGAFLSVNVLPDVLDHPAVREVLEAQAPLSGVVVELTEHNRIDCYEALRPELDRLREAGAVIAVDDTGAGYAGLQHLIGIRPDVIKLDRALIAGIDRDRPRRSLVDMICQFASRFDSWILAEGVETPEELATLVELGVPLAQGFHLGRPAPSWQCLAPHVEAELRANRTTSAAGTLRTLLEPAGRTYDAGLIRASRTSVLPVHVDSDIAESVMRAMARPLADRFEPLLCTDDDGRIVGIVRIERAVQHLAAEAAPPAADD